MKIQIINDLFYGSEKKDTDKFVKESTIFQRKINKNDTRRRFHPDGIFSEEIFGSLEGNEVFTCSCGNLTGIVHEGKTCPDCRDQVKVQGSSLHQKAYISLGDYKIVKFIYWRLLQEFLGKTLLEDYNNEKDEENEEENSEKQLEDKSKGLLNKILGIIQDGNYVGSGLKIDEEGNVVNNSDFSNIGVINFYERYDDILNAYYEMNLMRYENKPKKLERIKRMYTFLKDKENVFTDRILVLPLPLRKVMRTPDGVTVHPINQFYLNILTSLKAIRNVPDISPLDLNAKLAAIIHKGYLPLCQYVIDKILAGKYGFIRDQINGTKMNYTARLICAPGPANMDIRTVYMPYLAMVYLYKYEIISTISKLRKITLYEALEEWDYYKNKFNPEYYNILNKMIHDYEVPIGVNRNPTLAYGSFIVFKIAKVKKNIEDMTFNLSNVVLPGLNADFDGDVLNLYALKEKEIIGAMNEVFSIKEMLIDPNNGNFNRNLLPNKDIVIGMYELLKD